MGIVIVGCGGVGSWLAHFLARKLNSIDEFEKMVLIDFDLVERKNLERQFFYEDDIGKNKAVALKERLRQLITNPKIEIVAYDKKLDSLEELELIVRALDQSRDNGNVIYITTDSAENKKMLTGRTIENYKTIAVSCDKGVIEIEARYGSEVWQITEGYNSTQDFSSNLLASWLAYMYLNKTTWSETNGAKYTYNEDLVIRTVIKDEQ